MWSMQNTVIKHLFQSVAVYCLQVNPQYSSMSEGRVIKLTTMKQDMQIVVNYLHTLSSIEDNYEHWRANQSL